MQLDVEGVPQPGLGRSEREGAAVDARFPVDERGEGCGRFGLGGLRHDRAGGERRTGEDVNSPCFHGVQPRDLVRDDQDVALLVPGVDGVLDLRVAGAGGELRLLRDDVLVVVQPLRVALADDESVQHLVVRVGEDDLRAALRGHVHPGGHDVELLRVQAGYERAELGGHGLHLVDAEPLEDRLRQLRRLTGQLTVLVDVPERDLTRYPEPYDALRLQPGEQITAVRRRRGGHPTAAGRAQRTCRRHPGEQCPAGVTRRVTGCVSVVPNWWSHGRAATRPLPGYAPWKT